MPMNTYRFACLLFVLFVAFGCTAVDTTSTRVVYLSGQGPDDAVDWRFRCSEFRRAGEWSTIPVPSQWEQHGFGRYGYGRDPGNHAEKGFYRTTFKLDADDIEGNTVRLVFEGVMTDAAARVNGERAGPTHRGGYTAFKYDVTNLVRPGDNTLAVDVAKRSSSDHINKSQRRADFWLFGGIYRPVYLEISPREHIDRVAIDADMHGKFAMSVFTANVDKADRVTARITMLAGDAVGRPMSATLKPGAGRVNLKTGVSDAKLWSPEQPNLYKVQVTLYAGDAVVHTHTERFGFRTFEARKSGGFYLNGKRIFIKGVNRHCFRAESGRTLSRDDSYEDAKLIKFMNMNTVRSHYAPDKHFLEACDELGLMYITELCAWHHPVHESEGVRLVKELVSRDVNHPSLIMWSNGNHGGYNHKLSPEFHKHDPQERQVLWMDGRNTKLKGPAIAGMANVDTRFYPSYEMLSERLAGPHTVVPCEALHALYDGGGGAGLDDFWKAITSSRYGGGLVFWAYADEGIARTDRDGELDTAVNAAPDGLVGPRLEKEASVYTVRRVFAPVRFEGDPTTGELRVHNRHHATNLDECAFERTLINYTTGRNPSQALVAPGVAARQSGTLDLQLPADWQKYDAIELVARSPGGVVYDTWRWPMRHAYLDAPSPVLFGKVDVDAAPHEVTVTAAGTVFTFDRATARLLSVKRKGKTLPLANGPDLVYRASDPFLHDKTGERKLGKGAEARGDEVETPGAAPLGKGLRGVRWVDAKPGARATVAEKDGAVVISQHNQRGFGYLGWTVYADGTLLLQYVYERNGWHDFFGVTFDYDETKCKSVAWRGLGPQRVWKNRTLGPTFGEWRKDHKDLMPGKDFDYPFFKGFYGEMHRLDLIAADSKVRVFARTGGLSFRLFDPKWGEGKRKAVEPIPQGDVSFMHAIPPIGTKWRKPHVLGPASYPTNAEGRYDATLHFQFVD